MTGAPNGGFVGLRVVGGARKAENGGIDKVSLLVAGTLAKRGLARHALASLTIHRVNGWLAERFPGPKSVARAERVQDGVLSVACDHSVILQELQLGLPELKRFLAVECPFTPIAEIRVVRSSGTPENALAPGNPPA